MTYTLEAFCSDARELLAAKPGPAGRQDCLKALEKLLKDDDFLAAYCGPGAEPGIQTVYRDPELDFNVLVHRYAAGKSGPPHDHGESWAIYGQAVGETIMSTWKRLDDGSEDGKAKLEKDRTYELGPGMAGIFEPKDIHSIVITDNCRFVRVTGTDLGTINTLVFNAEDGTVKPGNRL
ncbi:MAG: hypothetical protein AAF441_11955 [Pseudomonadota bacterium]